MFKTLVVATLTLASLATPALARFCEALTPGPTARVAWVSDGDTLELDTGLTVRLVGIQAPKLPLGREGFEAWPLGDEAKAHLEDLTLGREVTLHYGGESRDRHGRALAHVTLGTGDGEVWVQGAMLEAGLARVYTFPDNRNCVAALYAAERIARAGRHGIWRDPFYAVRDGADHDAVLTRLGEYELVEGRVLNADIVGSRAFLNFGRSWREDFTVVIEGPALRLFEREQFDITGLENSVIRVRGWIDRLDGPRMLVTHPEQIEILSTQ